MVEIRDHFFSEFFLGTFIPSSATVWSLCSTTSWILWAWKRRSSVFDQAKMYTCPVVMTEGKSTSRCSLSNCHTRAPCFPTLSNGIFDRVICYFFPGQIVWFSINFVTAVPMQELSRGVKFRNRICVTSLVFLWSVDTERRSWSVRNCPMATKQVDEEWYSKRTVNVGH